MYDEIIGTCIHTEQDEFIDCIKDQICSLASSYHDGDRCEFFQDFKKGSYNVCFFVQFFRESELDKAATGDHMSGVKPNGERWVVRVPLWPSLAIHPWDKLEVEVATMQLVASRTTIPVPKIHAYSTTRTKSPHGIASFLVMDYVDGKNLLELGFSLRDGARSPPRHKLYTQLAEVYIQLRRLEFPAIGRLVPGPDGRAHVGKAPFSSAMNQQHLEVEGVLDMIETHGRRTGFTSANGYISLVLDMAFHLFSNSRANFANEAEACRELYFLDQFSQHVRETWIEGTLDSGPFVLAHGDLQISNLLFSDDLELLAVIDWEWAQTVPLQLFLPPSWFSGSDMRNLGYGYEKYAMELDRFCAVVEEKEKQRYGKTLLSRDWAGLSYGGSVLVGMALQHWPTITPIMRGYLDLQIHPSILTRNDRIQQFIDEKPSRRDLVAKKVAARAAYNAEMEELESKDPE